MIQKIKSLIEVTREIHFDTAEALEQYRIHMLGKKGQLNALFEEFKALAADEKREVGQLLNTLKQSVQDRIDSYKANMTCLDSQASCGDLSRPAHDFELGARHPLALVRRQMLDVFARMGFILAEGPEIEDDWHIFTALNFAPEHPARDMQDTFFIENNGDGNDIALRTHTSSVQVRMMEQNQPPIRAVFPGRVYRNEAISARAHCFFHQIEGLYIDHHVSFLDLRETMLQFAKEMFGKDTQIRLRPSYFPFTEPSAEMDISCNICKAEGCSFCKHTGWVEILGCGMVDPNVLRNCGIDPEIYSGFAFGIGVERTTNLIYAINDLRLFSENDQRFLSQFRGSSF